MFSMMQTMPYASVKISGNSMHPEIERDVFFYEVYGGTMVVASVKKLPDGNGFHGFHIHDGSSCTPMSEGGHYNPTDQLHPQHVGDMPPLLANDGTAYSAFYTKRFYPEDVVGKVVVIHANPDDFVSQPSGNPGSIVACGEIKRFSTEDKDACRNVRDNMVSLIKESFGKRIGIELSLLYLEHLKNRIAEK